MAGVLCLPPATVLAPGFRIGVGHGSLAGWGRKSQDLIRVFGALVKGGNRPVNDTVDPNTVNG